MLKPPQSLPLPQPQPTVAGIINTFHWAWNRNRESMYDNIVFFFLLFFSHFVLFYLALVASFANLLLLPLPAAKVFHCLTAVFFFLHNCNCIVVKGWAARERQQFLWFFSSLHFMQITSNFIKAFHLQFCRSILLAARFADRQSQRQRQQTALTSHIYCCLLIFLAAVRVYTAFSALTIADNNK